MALNIALLTKCSYRRCLWYVLSFFRFQNPILIHCLGGERKYADHGAWLCARDGRQDADHQIRTWSLYADAYSAVHPTQHQRALLDQWTQFLIEDSLIPAFQLSTDDFAGQLANQTNLAIKGIIGIRCMAEISKLLGDNNKFKNYSVCEFRCFRRCGRLILR